MNFKKVGSYLVVVAIFGFLFWNIASNWQVVSAFPWQFRATDLLLLATFLLPIYLINVYSWHLVTKAVGCETPFLKNIRVWAFSNISRFLPGGFWQYPGRIYLLSKEGPSKILAATAVVVESLFNLAVGSLVVVLAFVFWQLPIKIKGIEGVFVFIIFLPLFLSVLSNELIATRLVRMLQKATGRGETLKKIRLPMRWIPPLTIAFFLQYFLAGSALFFLSKSAVDLSFNLLPSFIGIFAASWLLGYITFFAPGGLGVQEASIAGLLALYMPFPVASLIAVAFRSLLFVSEGLLLFLAFRTLGKENLFKDKAT